MIFIQKLLTFFQINNNDSYKNVNSNSILKPDSLEKVYFESDSSSQQKVLNFQNVDLAPSMVPQSGSQFSAPLDTEIPNPYVSKRLIIKGVHLYFIDIARDIVAENSINKIHLMREYNVSESELEKIISEIQKAQIIDSNYNVLMNSTELEKFIDVYEPDLFSCKYSLFDKEIFTCLGKTIYDKGIDTIYDSMPAEELLDYLNIMEKLKILKYNSYDNKYEILLSYSDFYEICQCIPDIFSSITYNSSSEDDQYADLDYDNISGIEFERFCAYILSQNDFYNIKMTPATGDHGIDLFALKDDISYAIQCKCYSSNVGNAAIQQAHTGKNLYHKDIAVVLTNQYFTSQAIDEAKILSVKLWDRDKLNYFIKTAKEKLIGDKTY